jgi:hypothetical protein
MTGIVSQTAAERDFQDRVAGRRLDRISGVGQQGVLWLAVVPAWTEEVAAAVGYPSGDRPLADFVGRAEKAGLCVRSQSSAPDLAALLRVRALAIGSGEDSARRALAAVQQIRDERRSTQALIELVSWLPDQLLEPAVTLARSLGAGSRARVLAAVLDRGFPSAAPDLAAQAVAAAWQAAPAVRLQVLTQLAPILPAPLREAVLPELLTAIEEADDPLQLANLLGRLPSALGPEDLSRALGAAVRIADPAARASSLASLAARFPEDQRLTVLAEAEAAATLVYQPGMRDLVQGLVAEGYARAERPRQAHVAASQIAGSPARAASLGELAAAAARQGRDDEMEMLVGEALNVLATVPPDRSAVVLAEVAVNLAQAGVGHAAVELIDRAQLLARRTGPPAWSRGRMRQRALSATGPSGATRCLPCCRCCRLPRIRPRSPMLASAPARSPIRASACVS